MGNFMEILKKHSALVSITNKDLSLTQKKSLNIFYMTAKKALESGQKPNQWYKLELKEMRRLLGIEDTNKTYLINELWKLVKIEVEYNIFKKDKKVEWGKFGLLSNDLKIDYDNNGKAILYFKLPEKIEENLILPNIFAKVDLELIKELKSKYVVPFYELLEDYKNVNVPYMTVQEFRKFLGIKKDEYKLFADLKKRIVEVIKQEINEKTPFTIDFELKKEARKVVGIQWRIVEYNNKKMNQYFEKMEFIENVRNNYKQGEALFIDVANGVTLLMGKNGLLAKKYDWKKKPETVKKDLAMAAWTWLFEHQELMEKPRGFFRI